MKVIVATDFSDAAANAARYAAEAAAEHKLELILFTLYQVSVHALNARSSAETLNQMLVRYQSRLEREAERLRQDYGVPVTVRLASGSFVEELKKCISETGADLVVMGMPKKSLEQDLLGNTTTAAIHLLKFPVMAIPADVTYQGIRQMLFACDITRGVHATILQRVREFAGKFGASVEVFHVSKKRAQLDSEIQIEHQVGKIGEELAGIDHSYKQAVADGIVSAIREELEAIGADLLIMVPYKYGFWNSLVHRSKTRMMASRTHVPLLSLPI